MKSACEAASAHRPPTHRRDFHRSRSFVRRRVGVFSRSLCTGAGWGHYTHSVPDQHVNVEGSLLQIFLKLKKPFRNPISKQTIPPPPLNCISDSQTSPLVFIPPPWLVFAVPFMLVTYLTSWRSQSLVPYSSGPALLFIPEDSLVLGSQGLIQELALDLIPRSSVH